MEDKTGNKQVIRQFTFGEVLRWERGADTEKVVQEGFLEQLTFKPNAKG